MTDSLITHFVCAVCGEDRAGGYETGYIHSSTANHLWQPILCSEAREQLHRENSHLLEALEVALSKIGRLEETRP